MNACSVAYSLLLCKDYIDTYKNVLVSKDHEMYPFSTIDKQQRDSLIKWMDEICNIYRQSCDTFTTAIYLFDSYTKLKKEPIVKLQLIAGTCVLLAGMYEERYYPALSELVYLCDGLYKEDDFLAMEIQVLQVLGYRVTHVNPRFACMVSTYGQEVEEDVFAAIDFLQTVAVWSHPLTFANPFRVGTAIMDTIQNGPSIDEEFSAVNEKDLICQQLDENERLGRL